MAASPPDAAAQAISEFTVTTASSAPTEITAGPDGAMWFTEQNGNRIGRITVAGTPAISEFPVTTPASHPEGIIAGPDGNLWFTENAAGKIGRITTLGVVTEYAIATPNSQPLTITVGTDGNLWFAEQTGNAIGRITTAGVISEYPLPTAGSMPQGIRPGSDGALWFTEAANKKIGRITTAGVITEFANPNAAAQPSFIAPFPNGGLVFTEAQTDQLGMIGTDGTFQGEASFPTPGGGAGYISLGPDGGLWFTEHTANKIARIVPTSAKPTFREYAIPTAASNPTTVSAGPDGNLWFTEQDGNKIGRLTPPASGSPLVAAVLPGSRSVQTGRLATVFATMINSGTASLDNCGVVPLTPVGASLSFQTTDPSTNGLTGTPNTRVTIPGGNGSKTFLIALTPNAPQTPTNVTLGFDCDDVDPAQPVVGVNTLLLSGSATATPDMIALAATPSNDGILNITGTSGSAAFSVATANVGAGGQVTVFVDTGSAAVNATFTICQTRPTTGACIFDPHATDGPIIVGANETPTFSIFATATGAIQFSPAVNRVFVRFQDPVTRETRGSTNVAVRTQ